MKVSVIILFTFSLLFVIVDCQSSWTTTSKPWIIESTSRYERFPSRQSTRPTQPLTQSPNRGSSEIKNGTLVSSRVTTTAQPIVKKQETNTNDQRQIGNKNRWNSNIPRIPETTAKGNNSQEEKFISSLLSGGKKPTSIFESIATLNPDIIRPTLATYLTVLNSCVGERQGWTDYELGDFTVGPDSPYCSSSCLRNFFCCVPMRPEEMSVRFIMSTNEWDAFDAHIGDERLRNAVNRDRKPFVWLIHGFMNNVHIEPAHNQTKDAWIRRGYNVIVVDWHLGNRLYLQSIANVRVVGALVGQLMHYLGVYDRSICAGFSLGSHICGEAGQFIKRRGGLLSTCHGIDPAGPGFDGCGIDIRLDPSDCGLVTSIHSSQFISLSSLLGEQGLGTKYKSGHCDFWMNHGLEQPQCDKATFGTAILNLFKLNFSQLGKDVEYTLACSHWRGFHYYLGQVRGDCNFQGIEGECGGGTTCTRDGLNSSSQTVSSTDAYNRYTSTTERYPSFSSTRRYSKTTERYQPSTSNYETYTRPPNSFNRRTTGNPYSDGSDNDRNRPNHDSNDESSQDSDRNSNGDSKYVIIRGKRNSRDRVNNEEHVEVFATETYEDGLVTSTPDYTNTTSMDGLERGIIRDLAKKVFNNVVNRFIPRRRLTTEIPRREPDRGDVWPNRNTFEGNRRPDIHHDNANSGYEGNVGQDFSLSSGSRQPDQGSNHDNNNFVQNEDSSNRRPGYESSSSNSFNENPPKRPGILGSNQNNGNKQQESFANRPFNPNHFGNNNHGNNFQNNNNHGNNFQNNRPSFENNNNNWVTNFIEAPFRMTMSPDDSCDVNMNVDYKIRTTGTFPYC